MVNINKTPPNSRLLKFCEQIKALFTSSDGVEGLCSHEPHLNGHRITFHEWTLSGWKTGIFDIAQYELDYSDLTGFTKNDIRYIVHNQKIISA